MRIRLLNAAFIALVGIARPCSADVIPLADFPRGSDSDFVAGIHITPTNSADLAFFQGDLEVLGASALLMDHSNAAQYYSGIATFDRPVNHVTVDVGRLNNSGWESGFHLVAFSDGKRVQSVSTEISSLGDTTQVTVAAPSIDKIDWTGDGWVFHPYVIRDLQFSFATTTGTPSVGGTSSTPPIVGSAVPEPGAISLILLSSGLLLRRKR